MTMTIDDLIEALRIVRKAHGNLDVLRGDTEWEAFRVTTVRATDAARAWGGSEYRVDIERVNSWDETPRLMVLIE